MKSYLLIAISICIAACSTNQTQVSQNANSNSQQPMRAEKLESTTAHTTENQPPKSGDASGGKWSASGEPIDTAKFDGVIAEAEKAAKAKPNDEAVKKTLAQAYFARGEALTEARQYAAAIGDYRKALKLDSTHEGSKKWIEEISRIYRLLKKEAPKEGEEPPPLPFKKAA